MLPSQVSALGENCSSFVRLHVMPLWIVTSSLPPPHPFTPNEFRAYECYETDSTQNEILSLAIKQSQNWQFSAVFSIPSLTLSTWHNAAVCADNWAS